jgi:D-arabinitol 4-dehydrogenase
LTLKVAPPSARFDALRTAIMTMTTQATDSAESAEGVGTDHAQTPMLVMLHLGLGSFHRAHQAVYLQRLIDSGDARWCLVGGNIRADMSDTVAALIRQRGEYTLETVSPSGERDYERIRSIRRVVAYTPDLAELIDVGASPSTRIISFTVTEAGYYLDPHNRLDASLPDIRTDLAGESRRTIYGAITAVLRERMTRNAGPVTLLNCDNLRSNGDRFRAGLLDFLQRSNDTALHAWVLANTTCPNDMVDRITPRPLPDVAERVKAATGWADAAPVMGERFIQWVIEDHFCNGRPAWENVGAQMVESVLPFEEAKIRILNSSHSCIAWAGTLIGMQYIHEGVVHPAIRQMAFDYVTHDVMPSLHTPEQPCPIDLAAYRDVVLDRFSNPHLRDTNQRVAMDGFAKIPGFLWPTLKECLARGASVEKTATLPALFFVFLSRWHRGELSFEYQDQGMDAAAAHAFFDAPDPLLAFCHDAALWGPLAGNAVLTAAIQKGVLEVHHFIKANSNG